MIDYMAAVAEDAVEFPKAIYMIMDAFLPIPLYERGGLAMVDIQTLLDGLLVVVGSATLLPTEHQTLHQLFLGDIKLNHGCHLVPTLRQHLLQCLGLGNRAGKAVEDDALVLLAETVVDAGKDVNHQLIGNELSLVDISLGRLAKFRPVLNLTAQHIPRGDMPETILSNHLIALRAFA